jgi:glucuronokinase
MDSRGYGTYRTLDPSLLPPLYIAYRTDLSEGSEKVHSRLRERYELGDSEVCEAIEQWIALTQRFVEALQRGDRAALDACINENFDIRTRVCPLSEANLAMVEAARSVGASAKFTGSGGAIIGSYTDEAMYRALCDALQPHGAAVLKPQIADGYAHTNMQ